jgi:hypothetical protein
MPGTAFATAVTETVSWAVFAAPPHRAAERRRGGMYIGIGTIVLIIIIILILWAIGVI